MFLKAMCLTGNVKQVDNYIIYNNITLTFNCNLFYKLQWSTINSGNIELLKLLVNIYGHYT